MTLARSVCEAPLQADEKQTFVTEIATQHGRKLRRYLAARLRNAADVSDLVQEVFLRLLRVEDHESIRMPEAYVFALANHVLYQHRLRQARKPEAVDILDVLTEMQTVPENDPSAQTETQQPVE